MALETGWYDFVCFGIVGIAFVGALWVLGMNEGASQRDFETTSASLLLSRPDDEVVLNMLPRGHVSTSKLWMSCWRGLHPLCLLSTRFLSFLIMLFFLLWDVLKYDASIFVYYTEWTFTLGIIYFALGTIVSAYGCWKFFNKPLVHNEANADFLRRDVEETMSSNLIAYQEKEAKGSIKLESRYVEDEFQQRAGFWGYLMQTTYQTCAGAAILTDVVFWCVIVPFLSISHLRLSLLMGCMHALNAFFLLLDTALNNLQQSTLRIAYITGLKALCSDIAAFIASRFLGLESPILFSGAVVTSFFNGSSTPLVLNGKTTIFSSLSLVSHKLSSTLVVRICSCSLTGGHIPFSCLMTSGLLSGGYLCLAVIHVPCYGLYYLIVREKNRILPRLFPRAFLRPH
ncbi:hypothetical protein CR513_23326, partial [Mucuna pruriens]